MGTRLENLFPARHVFRDGVGRTLEEEIALILGQYYPAQLWSRYLNNLAMYQSIHTAACRTEETVERMWHQRG